MESALKFIGILQVVNFALLCLVLYALEKIFRILVSAVYSSHEAPPSFSPEEAPRPSPLKPRTLSRMFGVKKPRKVIYNDDEQAFKNEQNGRKG